MPASASKEESSDLSISDDIQALSFESAMAALEAETQRLESGQLSLAESLAAYQKGAALLRHAQNLLQVVQEEIEVIDEQGRRTMSRADFISDHGR